MGHAMDQHRRNDPRVVDLFARDGISNHQPPPFRMHAFVVRQKGELLLQQSNLAVCFSGGQAATVLLLGSRQDIPKLNDVLRYAANISSIPDESINSGHNERMLRIVAFGHPDGDVGVHEVCRRPGQFSHDRRR